MALHKHSGRTVGLESNNWTHIACTKRVWRGAMVTEARRWRCTVFHIRCGIGWMDEQAFTLPGSLRLD